MPDLAVQSTPPSELAVASYALNLQQYVWGAHAEVLHERYWASRRIQVVRQGSGAAIEPGADLYLLVRPLDLLLFDPSSVLRTMSWLNPPLMRIRVVDAHHEAYTERTEGEPGGQFVRIVRQYTAQTRTTTQVWLTARRRAAESWSDGSRMSHARTRLARAGARPVPAKVDGRIFSLDDQDQQDAFLLQLAAAWPDPGRMFDGVFQYQPRVWVHESSRIDPTARFVAPIWLGAGVEVHPGELCVGPLVVGDEHPPDEPGRPIDWDDLAAPQWSFAPPLGQRARFVKRSFDVAFSLLVLLATSWLYPIVILVILIEDGRPAFFAHRRQTIGGREFPCYKFRTMRRDADRLKDQLQAQNQADGPQFYMENDPRLLKSGRLFRKLQIDELPQFWNVLLGHMSVVGPRPSPDKENQYCPAWREARLSVRPGVTGLWQVSRTRVPQTDFQEWIKYDLEYVQRATFRLDVWIIVNTLKKLLGK